MLSSFHKFYKFLGAFWAIRSSYILSMIKQIHRKQLWTTLKSLYNGLVDIRIFMLSFFRKFYTFLGAFWAIRSSYILSMIKQIHRKQLWTTLKSLYNGLVNIHIFMLSFFRKFYKFLGECWAIRSSYILSMIKQIHGKQLWTTLKSLYNGLVDIRIFILSFFANFISFWVHFGGIRSSYILSMIRQIHRK